MRKVLAGVLILISSSIFANEYDCRVTYGNHPGYPHDGINEVTKVNDIKFRDGWNDQVEIFSKDGIRVELALGTMPSIKDPFVFERVLMLRMYNSKSRAIGHLDSITESKMGGKISLYDFREKNFINCVPTSH